MTSLKLEVLRSAGPQSHGAGVRVSGAVRFLTALLLTIGVVTRLLPLLDRGGRLLRQFPTEDGYLMLTIARNLASGHGLSTAAGSIPTNGTQPLVNFLYALGYLVTGGDKRLGVLIALLWQFAFAVATAWFLWRLGKFIWQSRAWGRSAAALASAAWFASPQGLPHTMNCLETGAYAMVVVLFALYFTRAALDPAPRPRWKLALISGLFLGLAFWVRNDAVFLSASACLFLLFFDSKVVWHPSLRGMVEALVAGLTAAACASPWMIYSLRNFGSVVPISGTSQSFAAGLGSHIELLPVKLLEYASIVLGVPLRYESRPLVVVLGVLLSILLVVAALWIVFRCTGRERCVAVLLLIFGTGLSAYYGLVFGAPHFLGRYLFPLSPFIALLVVGWLHDRARRIPPWAMRLAAAVLLPLIIAQHVRIYALGTDHMHFQVVQWIEANTSEEDWVGAVQTGTVGYFHDRTINLDGKVNPEALRARMSDRIFEYVLQRDIEVLADWYGIEVWAQSRELAAHFEVVVADPVENLSVLRRRR
jgi:hypothetical protein